MKSINKILHIQAGPRREYKVTLEQLANADLSPLEPEVTLKLHRSENVEWDICREEELNVSIFFGCPTSGSAPEDETSSELLGDALQAAISELAVIERTIISQEAIVPNYVVVTVALPLNTRESELVSKVCGIEKRIIDRAKELLSRAAQIELLN